jgi:cytochrome o ubiquinol oxidase operon protein cyoD
MDNPKKGNLLPGHKTYITGFLLSLLLTLTAYFLVARHVSSHHAAVSHFALIFMVVALAIIQLLVQLTFFLHLDTESSPRWNLKTLLFAALVVIILVFGSLWIMNNLNYHHPTQNQINDYLKSQGDL